MRQLSKVILVSSLIMGLTSSFTAAQSKDGQISACSTDKNHSNADKVLLESGGRTTTVVVALRRGIGSARIQLGSEYRGKLSLEFRGFTRLENFLARSGDKCIEASLGLPATSIGPWSNGHCYCTRSPSEPDVLKMRVSGKSILLDIPVDFVRSNHSQNVDISWIDAYR